MGVRYSGSSPKEEHEDMLHIEPFQPSDFDAALALWRRSEGIGLSGADTREGIERFLAHNPRLSFVARRSGAALVGAVLCGTDGRRGYLHHLAVDAAERRRGTGRALAERCAAELRARGIAKCHLFVLADNVAAVAFWERTGWTLRRDVALMSRSLEP